MLKNTKKTINIILLLVFFISIDLIFSEARLRDSFESGISSNWSINSGDYPWQLDPSSASDGSNSIQCGILYNGESFQATPSAADYHNSSSILLINQTVNSGEKIIFYFAMDPGRPYDTFSFHVDGVSQNSWKAGDTNVDKEWHVASYNIESDGEHEFKWLYERGSSIDLCSRSKVPDCSGDGTCCSHNWATDSYADCEDQAYGCDLSCYDDDGAVCTSLSQENGDEFGVRIDKIIFGSQAPVISFNTDLDQIEIPNSTGIPGESITIDLPGSYLDYDNTVDPDNDEFNSISWFTDGWSILTLSSESDACSTDLSGFSSVDAIVDLSDGAYCIKLSITDEYDTEGSNVFKLILNEYNVEPEVSDIILSIDDIDNPEIICEKDSDLNFEEVILRASIIDSNGDINNDNVIDENDMEISWTCDVGSISSGATNVEAILIVPNIIDNDSSPIMVSCDVTVKDRFDASAELSKSFEVHNYNEMPQFSSDVAFSVEEDNQIAFSISGLSITATHISSEILGLTDNDSDTNSDNSFSFQLYDESDDNNYTLSDDVNIIPDENFAGLITVPISIDDNIDANCEAELVNSTMTITFTAINDKPIFTLNETTIEIDEDSVPYEQDSWASDIDDGDDDSVQNLTFNLSGYNPAIFSSGNEPQIDSSGKLSFELAENKNGTTIVSTILSDDGSPDPADSEASEFTIIVTPINDTPIFVLNETAIEVDEDSDVYSSTGWASSIDDGDPEIDQSLEFTLSGYDEDLFDVNPEISSSGDLSFQVKANQFGSTTVDVILSDCDEAVCSDGTDSQSSNVESFTININSINDEPVFDVKYDETVYNDDIITTQENFTDPIIVSCEQTNVIENENSQSITYSISPDPSSISFVNISIDNILGTITFTSIPDENGEQEFTVTATDDGDTDDATDVNISSTTFTLNVVNTNNVPVFTFSSSDVSDVANIVVDEDNFSPLSISLSPELPLPSGEENQAISYSILTPITWADISISEVADDAGIINKGILTISSILDQNGSGEIQVESNDGQGFNDKYTVSFNLTINPINKPPPNVSIDSDLLTSGELVVNEDGQDEENADSEGAFTIESFLLNTNEDGDPELNQNITFFIAASDESYFETVPVIDSDGTLTFKLLQDATGTTQLTLYSIDDGQDESVLPNDNQSENVLLNLVIEEINDLPEFKLIYNGADLATLDADPNIITLEEDAFDSEAVTIEVDYYPEPSENPYSYTISSTVDYANVEFSGSTISINVKEHGNGDAGTIEVIANDGQAEFTQTFSVIITPVNDPPVNTSAPFIADASGNEITEVIVGDEITAQGGEWNDEIDDSSKGITYLYSWQTRDPVSCCNESCWVEISTESSYEVSSDSAHQSLRLCVTAKDDCCAEFDVTSTETEICTDPITVLNTSPVAESEIGDNRFKTDENVNITAGDINSDTGIAYNVLLNDTDADGDLLSVELTQNFPVDKGVLTLYPNGDFDLIPTASYCDYSNDVIGSFKYKVYDTFIECDECSSIDEVLGVSDCNTLSEEVTAQIKIECFNDEPIVTPSLNEQTSENEYIEGVFFENLKLDKLTLDNWVNDDDETLRENMKWEVTGNTDLIIDITNRELTISVPDEDWFGQETLTVSVTDRGALDYDACPDCSHADGQTVDTPIIITVNPVNDPPSFDLDRSVVGCIYDSDVDCPAIDISSCSEVVLEDYVGDYISTIALNISKGHDRSGDIDGDSSINDYESDQSISFSVTFDNDIFETAPYIDENGDLSFNLLDNANGKSTVTITLTDDGCGGGVCPYAAYDGSDIYEETKEFDIYITPVNDPPFIVPGNTPVNVSEDAALAETTFSRWVSGIYPADPTIGADDEDCQSVNFTVDVDKPQLFKADKTPDIDDDFGTLEFELAPNYNGLAMVSVLIEDDGGNDNGGDDSESLTFDIQIDQVNDPFQNSFQINDNYSGVEGEGLQSYAIDGTAFYTDDISGVRTLRFPYITGTGTSYADQIADSEKYKFRFKFENFEETYLDIDTDPDKNLDLKLSIYYRLELINPLTNDVFILKDNIAYDDVYAIDPDGFVVQEINMDEEFLKYNGLQEYNPNTTTAELSTLDITGMTAYQWRVVAQNYWYGYGNDQPDYPETTMEVSSVDETSIARFFIDLTFPGTDISIVHNELYYELYDAYFIPDEATISDETYIYVNSSLYQPAIIDVDGESEFYHFSNEIVTTGNVSVSIWTRDLVENFTKNNKIFTFESIDRSLAETMVYNDQNFSIYFPEHALSHNAGIMAIKEFNDVILNKGSQYSALDSIYVVTPYSIDIQNPITVYFEKDILVANDLDCWKYIVRNYHKGEWRNLETFCNDDQIYALSNSLGKFDVVINPEATQEVVVPLRFDLISVYPNPFNPITTIEYSILNESNIEVSIYDILGHKITQLVDTFQEKGYYKTIWDGKNSHGGYVPSGVYFVQIKNKSDILLQKILLLK